MQNRTPLLNVTSQPDLNNTTGAAGKKSPGTADSTQSVRRKIPVPIFAMYMPKYRLNAQLPSYMQNLGSRLSLGTISAETCKANNFSSRDIQEISAALAKRQKLRMNTKKYTLGTQYSDYDLPKMLCILTSYNPYSQHMHICRR